MSLRRLRPTIAEPFPLVCPACDRHVLRLGVPCPCQQTCSGCHQRPPLDDLGLCEHCLAWAEHQHTRDTALRQPRLRWTGAALDRLIGAVLYGDD